MLIQNVATISVIYLALSVINIRSCIKKEPNDHTTEERIIFGSSRCVNQTTPISAVLVFPAYRCSVYPYSLHAVT